MKMKSYVVIVLLILILIFIIGVRYGQNVEKSNKVVNFILSITPTKSPTQTPITPTSYYLYSNKDCKLQFLLPSTITIAKESTGSAVFNENKNEVMEIECNSKSKIEEIASDPDIATGEVQFKNRKQLIKVTNNDSTYILKLFHPTTGKYFYVAIQKILFPLFENSVKF